MSKTAEALLNLIPKLEEALRESLDEVADLIVSTAKESDAFKDKTGELRKGIFKQDTGRWSRSAVSPQGYAQYVEFGNNKNGPWIYPVKAKALKFEIDGQVFFRKRVRSHGPLPYMQPAADYTEKQVDSIFERNIRRILT